MTPILNEWTIVIVGSWNIAILNPEWVSKQIFEDPKLGVEVLVGAGQTGLRFTSGQVQMIPTPDRIIISPTSTTAMAAAENVVVKLLEELPVTPIASVGINFGFLEQEPAPDLLSLFDLEDTVRIGEQGWLIQDTSILRTLQDNEKLLNLRLTHKAGQVSFHLNFHHDVGNAEGALTAIRGKVDQLRADAANVLQNIYRLEEESSDA